MKAYLIVRAIKHPNILAMKGLTALSSFINLNLLLV